MQALANFADLTYGSSMNMNIKMDDGQDVNEFEITSKNNLVLQQVEVSPEFIGKNDFVKWQDIIT